MVMKKLQQLKTDKSPGPYGIHPLLLKEGATVLAKPLSLIFSQSYNTGILPDEWKTAHIVPIFTKGNTTDPANYGPLSLTSVPCKVMETIVKENLVKFWENKDIFCKEQHGFYQREIVSHQLT